MNFTVTIENIKNLPVKAKRYTIRDTSRVGLCVRVQPTGKVSYYYIRKVAGRKTESHLGAFPEVTPAEAIQKYLDLSRGGSAAPAFQSQGNPSVTDNLPFIPPYVDKDPTVTIQLPITIQEAITVYSRSPEGLLKLRHKTQRDYQRYLEEFCGFIGPDTPVASVGPEKTLAFLRGLRHYKVKMNRAKAAISSFCKYAILEQEWGMYSNPTQGQPRKAETPKSRFLSGPEIAKLLPALRYVPEEARTNADILRLILMTSRRPSEVAHMRVEELDLEAGVWILPKERNGKGRRDHLLPLTETAIRTLGPHIQGKTSGLVFTSINGGKVDSTNVGQLLGRKLESLKIPHATPHDLRRTAAHYMERTLEETNNGDDILIALMNHAPRGVTFQVYTNTHVYKWQNRKLEALEQWEEKLKSHGLV